MTSKKTFSKLPLILTALVFGVAVLVTIAVKVLAKVPPSLETKLSDAFPANITGWAVRDLPLGPTEVVVEASKEILGFDDYINREYSNGANTVGVYIAYWKPGTAGARTVRGHIPDNCWVEAGWRMEMPPNKRFQLSPQLELERRTFMAGPQRVDVIYAQIVAGEIHAFSKAQAAGLIDDLMHYWDLDSAGRKDQFFIRISSSASLDDLRENNLFGAIQAFVAGYVLRGK